MSDSAAAGLLDMEFVSEARGQRMSPALPDTLSVVKQEATTGFLQSLPEAGSEYDESSLIKTELNCLVQLRMLREGKEFWREPEPKVYEVSEETRRLQEQRKAKNREAAKKCRMKKKKRGELLRVEKENEKLRLELQKCKEEYLTNLRQLRSRECFKKYIRQNPHLLRDANLGPLVKNFSETAYHELPRCCFSCSQN